MPTTGAKLSQQVSDPELKREERRLAQLAGSGEHQGVARFEVRLCAAAEEVADTATEVDAGAGAAAGIRVADDRIAEGIGAAQRRHVFGDVVDAESREGVRLEEAVGDHEVVEAVDCEMGDVGACGEAGDAKVVPPDLGAE